jgi:uncharacterized membrane protein YtjA (UPF0391 family)
VFRVAPFFQYWRSPIPLALSTLKLVPLSAVCQPCLVFSLLFKDHNMLRYALIFLILAIVASVLGFGGIAGDAAWIARVLLIIFVVMFLVSLVMGRRVP